MKLPKKLQDKLKIREENNSLRILKTPTNLVDFSSNDYLGFAKSSAIFDKTHQFLIDKNSKQNGATGSRLLSGNHNLYSEVESFLSDFHQTESATIFNSGYDANIGFFSAVPQRNDIILYDEFSHASIRDGIQLSNAKSFKFLHNDLENLEAMLKRPFDCAQGDNNVIYVVTESVFSMDGDSPDLVNLAKICKKYNAYLIVDEAHALGVFGKNGAGLVQDLNLQNDVFARIITFGKALGCHGAAILGIKDLQDYIVNFARSFIYTTGLSPHSLATIKIAYNEMLKQPFDCAQGDIFQQDNINLSENIHHFLEEVKRLKLDFIPSCSAIHCCIISGNENVKSISEKFKEKGFEVKAILSPTVPQNQERLRFCLHSYNSFEEISSVLNLLVIFTTTEINSALK
ncbi:pyridoxal phosphate-dependent aminotransferase family protein [Polaribacter sp. Hel_I_88]|uniref:aminotransferase class I/II-fold pyridoxal phosphate-dependent enzyme n=1 Tax=Polaribacter sp. Hel_I_88 TaxID=1250006 RepID=UPI00055DE482|nr:pyridoxal phosphate-dependent aminotransferase family protein [Polaribacter sp. Hel_I_88]